MTAQVAGDGSRLEGLGLTYDHIVEFTLWFVVPFAQRHGLAMCKSLRRVIEIDDTAEADAEADLDVMCHEERIAASPECQRSACSLSVASSDSSSDLRCKTCLLSANWIGRRSTAS